MNDFAINKFKGFSLNPIDALKNISSLIECGRMLSVANDEELAEVGDTVIDLALQYALAACENNTPASTPTPAENIDLPNDSTIGERIRELRKLREMTVEELAREINVLSEYIRIVERGVASPISDTIIPLANALKCDPMWLLAGSQTEIAEES